MAEYLQRNINMDIFEMKLAFLMGTHDHAGKHSVLKRVLTKNKALADLRPFRHIWQFVWDQNGGYK